MLHTTYHVAVPRGHDDRHAHLRERVDRVIHAARLVVVVVKVEGYVCMRTRTISDDSRTHTALPTHASIY